MSRILFHCAAEILVLTHILKACPDTNLDFSRPLRGQTEIDRLEQGQAALAARTKATGPARLLHTAGDGYILSSMFSGDAVGPFRAVP